MYINKKSYKFIENILYENNIHWKVLEIWANSDISSFLYSKHIINCEKYWINISFNNNFIKDDINFLNINWNNLNYFKNSYFDCIICNAVLEHDKYFWKTISEINRVLKKGWLLIIWVPTYWKFKFSKFFKKILFNTNNFIWDFLINWTITFKKHSFPWDYYRFTTETIKDVFFENYYDIKIKEIMFPSRWIGYWFKK